MSLFTTIKKSIPNTLTCMSLFCGCFAVVCAMNLLFFYAMCFIFVGAVFDFSDGFAARLLNATSPIGKELDSLADQVTFGVAPGFVVYFWTASNFGGSLLPCIAFLITAFSALRLAKFNVDERQTSSFIGLATPANAIFFSSLLAANQENKMFRFLEDSPWYIVVLVVAFSLLLTSELPMFSFKFKHGGFKGNEDKFVLIGFAVLAMMSTSLMDNVAVYSAIPVIILFYIVICLFELLKSKKKA